MAPMALLLMACACTQGVTQTSLADERNRRSSGSARESRLVSWDIIDRAARFRTRVLAAEEPEVVTQPGYVHVRVPTTDSRPVDCFLYDSPLITGQAFVRLLRAAEIGIDYERIRLEAVLLSGKSPLVVLEATYREERGALGKLFVGLVPRVKIPLVCSHEGSSSANVRETIESLSSNLEPASDFSVDSLAEGEKLRSFELWALYREGRPIGFRQWRAAQNDAGEISTLEIASLLEPVGREITATDVRSSEREGAEGVLRLAEWLELVDGELHARAALEYVPEESALKEGDGARFSYRMAGLGPTGPFEKTLTVSEAFRSSSYVQEEIVRAEVSGAEVQFQSFLPNFRLDQGTRLHYRSSRVLGTPEARAGDGKVNEIEANQAEERARAGGRLEVGELEIGDTRFELMWEDGQFTRRRDKSGGIESRLLLRLP